MSTFILNPNDTIVMSDSIIVNVMKMAGTCHTGINEIATNWADVEIVKCICLTVAVVVLIVTFTIYQCYRERIKAEQKQKELELNNKREEREEQRLLREQEKNEKAKKDHSNTTQKTDSALAIEILKEIAALSKYKDCKVDETTTSKLYDLYNKIKTDIEKTKNKIETNNNE